MPIKEIMTWATVLLAGIIATHPLTWRTEVRKIQIAILRDVGDTRSWGCPSVFPGGCGGTRREARAAHGGPKKRKRTVSQGNPGGRES